MNDIYSTHKENAEKELKTWCGYYANGLTDGDLKEVLTSAGLERIVSGYQQRQAARVTTPRTAAASRENGKRGGRPSGFRGDAQEA